MDSVKVAAILRLGNQILASANVIVGFSLFLYILTHNRRSPVALAFCALTVLVAEVYLVDAIMSEVASAQAANWWLRVQWFGIALVPAGYLHFSDVLLRMTGSISRARRTGVWFAYSVGAVIFIAAALTDQIVNGVTQKEHIYHLVAGPWFWLFAANYVTTGSIGWLNISRARARCLTSASRRRMSYLMLAALAPGIGVFPFLLVPTTSSSFSANVISLGALVGNVGIVLMTMVIGYTVAYQGVLLPDRVVKHSLLHFLLRGPVVGILVIVLMLVIPRVEQILGLPRETILIITVAGSIVAAQVLISLAKPAIDLLVYKRDRREVEWMQALDQRLLTTADLEQLLENTLVALCDLLRSPSGFVVTLRGDTLSLRVFCGEHESASQFLVRFSLPSLLATVSKSRQDTFVTNEDFVLADGYWLLPLYGRSDKDVLGILGLRGSGTLPRFGERDLEMVYGLVQRIETALEDARLQQQVFAVLQRLGSELDQIQEWRSTPRYAGHVPNQPEANILHWDGFVQGVKDALSQLWGGPKLSQSPLLGMSVVRQRLDEQDQVPTKALRVVLQDAINRLRPRGERNMTANEWMMYNILDLRFIQGQRIRDVAQRLALSESDFYRKQKLAIEQVAQTLAEMERESKTRPSANPS